MSKKQFWIRLSLYVLFGGIIPVIFLILRFNLFTKIDSLSVGGWGIVAILFISIFFAKMIKTIVKGLPFSLFIQILNGICKVIIPLIAASFIVYYMQDCMKEIFQFLVVCSISELVAIVINPLPKWSNDNKIDKDKQTIKEILETLKK